MKTAFNPAPRHLLELLDTDWLNQMLAKRWPDAKVHDVSVVETLSTQATKVRLALTVTGGNQDMPHYICIKGALTETSVPSTASIIETQFYQNYAVKIPVRVPRCIYAELNAVGDNGIIVMEDEVQAGSCFLTALNPFNPDDVRDTLEQLALLHAHAWQGSELFEQAEVPRFLEQISAPAIMPMTEGRPTTDQRKECCTLTKRPRAVCQTSARAPVLPDTRRCSCRKYLSQRRPLRIGRLADITKRRMGPRHCLPYCRRALARRQTLTRAGATKTLSNAP
jgi:hypothetical protein